MNVLVDAHTRRLDKTTLLGGSPMRLLRLTAEGGTALDEIESGSVSSPAAIQLAQRMVAAGLAHPRRPNEIARTVTIVIPVRDRPGPLDACLASLTSGHSVVVVDDASRDSTAIAAVCHRHDARLIRRTTNGGPAAARNAGLSVTNTELVAFIDSDCVVRERDWIEQLAGHFGDPTVAAVAPRIAPLRRAGSAAASRLDRGPSESWVAPATRLPFVPSTAMVVRRSVLTDIGFDESLRYGEDVDLVWRLHEAGYRVRYDPTVVVAHDDPQRRRELLHRSYRYGTSAAALSLRHGEDVAPLAVRPWQAASIVALVAGRPVVAAGATGGAVAAAIRSGMRYQLPARVSSGLAARALVDSWFEVGRYVNEFMLPVAIGLAVAPGSRRRRRAMAMTALIASPGLRHWLTAHRDRAVVRVISDDISEKMAYGAGVWAGCVTHRTIKPLLPLVKSRQ